MRYAIVSLAAAAVFSLQLAAAPQPSMVISFDKNSFDADIAKGNGKAHRDIQGKPDTHFIPGVNGKGKAAVISRKERFSYRAEKNTVGSKGTISMWFAPQTWDFNNNHIFTLINISGSQAVRIFKHSWGPYIIGQFQWQPKPKGKIYSRQVQKKVDPAVWGKGKWHHLAITWDQDSMRLYLDGEIAKAVKDNRKTAPDYPVCVRKIFPEKLPAITPSSRIYVGDIFGSKAVPVTYSTAYDNIKIFDDPLTAAEIKAEYDSFAK